MPAWAMIGPSAKWMCYDKGNRPTKLRANLGLDQTDKINAKVQGANAF